MTAQENAIISVLELHAGLPRTSADTDDLSIVLWDMKKRWHEVTDVSQLQSAVQNILELIQQLNTELLVVRQTIAPRDRTLSEPLVYAMSGIVRLLLTALREAKEVGAPSVVEHTLIAATESIAFCWDQFVSGDTDDLRDELDIHNLTSGWARSA